MKYFENYRIQYKLIGKCTLPDFIGIKHVSDKTNGFIVQELYVDSNEPKYAPTYGAYILVRYTTMMKLTALSKIKRHFKIRQPARERFVYITLGAT